MSGRPPITGVILAGGAGRRMGGADKGLLLLAERPLAAWVLERLRPQVDALIVVANRNRARYEGLGSAVVADDAPDYPGPLAGIAAGLQAAAHELVAVVPCDCPLLPLDLVARLYDGLPAATAALVVARGAGRIQPLFCLCRRSVLPDLRAYLASGGRKVLDWQARLATVAVDFDDAPDAFRNANTPADVAALEASPYFSHRRPP